MRALRILVLSALFPGCVALDDAPAAVTPEGGADRWFSTTADPWIVVTRGCGFCSGNPEVPEARALVVYEDGRVLWFRFGMWGTQNGSRVEAGAPVSAWRNEVARIVPSMENYYTHERLVKVHEIAAGRLVGDEWSAVEAYLSHAIMEAEDPGEPNFDCQDCSAPYVDVLGDKEFHVQAYRAPDDAPAQFGNVEEGDAWDRILGQTTLVEEWVTQWKEP